MRCGKLKTAGNKWLEWTEKAGGEIEMYDYKTKKNWYGKFDPATGERIKTTAKPNRWASALKGFFKAAVKKVPTLSVPINIAVFEDYLNNSLGVPRNS